MQVENREVSLDTLHVHGRNYNRHSPAQIGKLAKSLSTFGQVRSIVAWVNPDDGLSYILAGHGVVEAARSLHWQTMRADVLTDCNADTALAYVIADNELARQSDPDQAQLAAILEELQAREPLLVEAAGYGAAELEALLRLVNPKPVMDAPAEVNRADELQAQWQTEAGQIWRIGPHTLICADCREPETWKRLLEGIKVNGVFTSPPYAEQRKEQYGGVPTDEYVDWWEAVQDNVQANLAHDGSFFVNIKPHCEDGQRVLYVMDLVLAMVRRWRWLYVDELCWKNPGVPGAWPNRFKDGFEPVYHFSSGACKFRPHSVSVDSDDVFSGPGGMNGRGGGGSYIPNAGARSKGQALPSNVIETGSGDGGHAAAFPIILPDFFIRAYSDPGDVWLDPFVGSGTTMVAAHQNGRIGLGIERLPSYCAVILERFMQIGVQPVLLEAAPILEGA